MTTSLVIAFVKALQTDRLTCLVFIVATLLQCDSNSGTLTEAGPADGIVSGTVTADGAPIQGAEVTLSGEGGHRTASTGADGRFTFDGLPPGIYTVAASSPDFTCESVAADIRAVKTATTSIGCIAAPIISLEISASPESLLVHQFTWLTVTARNDRGHVVSARQLEWTSSDPTVVNFTSTGVTSRGVTGLRRGTATITVSTEGVTAAVSLTVKARVRITPDYRPNDNEPVWYVAIGEARQFTASFVDVNGAPISEEPSFVTWASSNPGAVSVSSNGLVTVPRHVRLPSTCYPDPLCTAVITASTSDGEGTTKVQVVDVVAGLPATVRFVHAASGFGPLTFVADGVAPVTLRFGESTERPILSGTFRIHTEGASNPVWTDGLIRGGDYLSIYGVEAYYGLSLITAYPEHVSVPADSGLVRLIGVGVLVIDLQPSGAPMSATPELCYFDGGDTGYFSRPAGEFDVIFAQKQGDPLWRTSVTAESGRKLSFVIIGTNPDTWRLLAFPDP